MRYNLTQASHRVFKRAGKLRLQRGIAAISTAKLIGALFEEEECRAAQWLHEAGLTLEQFRSAFGIQTFGIQTLQSPISAPSFPMGSYGVPVGQPHSTAMPASHELLPTDTDTNTPSVGNPFSEQLLPGESQESPRQSPGETEQIEDVLEQAETPPLYSLYSKQQTRRASEQSRLQFYLDDQMISVGLLSPELEDLLEMTALRFSRQDRKPISLSGGMQIAMSLPVFELTTEHLLFVTVLDNGDVGRWLRDNGFEASELYERIDALHSTDDVTQSFCAPEASEPPSSEGESLLSPLNKENLLMPNDFFAGKDFAYFRLLDAAANRAKEALRVLEDYVRFILNSTDLTQRLKSFRHQFQDVLSQFPMQSRLEARNTEHDVGTDISAVGEYQRSSVGDILSANFSRLQESLRSLEEFTKICAPLLARQFEQLRYQCYTLHKDVAVFAPQSSDDGSSDSGSGERVSNTCRSILSHAKLYALVDCRQDEETFVQFVTDIIDGGVDIIQLRDKQANDRLLLLRSALLKQCIAESGRKVLFIMNDRPDLAVLAAADGVHVGQEELPVASVRQMVGAMLIGVSTHSIEQARQAAADGADYIGAGPVFESGTKDFSQFPGLDYLREAAAEITLPMFAIGGINEERLDEVLKTGIKGVAVSSAFLAAENPKAMAERCLEKWNEYARTVASE